MPQAITNATTTRSRPLSDTVRCTTRTASLSLADCILLRSSMASAAALCFSRRACLLKSLASLNLDSLLSQLLLSQKEQRQECTASRLGMKREGPTYFANGKSRWRSVILEAERATGMLGGSTTSGSSREASAEVLTRPRLDVDEAVTPKPNDVRLKSIVTK
jgi:hypothetical protein